LEAVPPRFIQELEDMLDKCNLKKVSWHNNMWFSVESWNRSVIILVYLDVKNYTDVVPLLKSLAKRDWKRTDFQSGDMTKTNRGFRWNLYREFSPYDDGMDEDFSIASSVGSVEKVELVIEGYVEEDPDDSLDKNVCRRVRTGMETRTYPTYKIVCPEDN
jgi:hypothetical protein